MAKILLVEDDPEFCETLEAMLTIEGHNVEPVGTGLEALEHMRMGGYDVVILDWHLPQMNGIDVLKEFRSGGGDTPVLMLTGSTDKSNTAELVSAGANDWLGKPCSFDQLVERLEMLLGR